MTKRLLTTSLATAMCLLGASRAAQAGTVTFSFDTMASGPSLANPSGDTLDNSIIQTYMRTMLGCAACVNVTGFASVDHAYTGDGHVVGGASGATSAPSKTLGTTDGAALGASTNGANDNFLKNYSPNTWFQIEFIGITVQSFSFDYEIFPDGTCTNITSTAGPAVNCGTSNSNLPDMTFSTNLAAVAQYWQAKTPGTSGGSTYVESPCTDTSSTTTGLNCTASTGTAGSYLGHELTPQLMGSYSLASAPAGLTTFKFTDWPATIGIDNLNITFTNNGGGSGQSAVPEPATMFLVGTGLVAAYRRRRKLLA